VNVSILRDARLLALRDLVAACRASSSYCAHVAGLLSDDPRGQALEDLAARRHEVADFFAERMIEADDIPEGQPEELSLLESALAGARAALANDGGAALIEACRAQEEKVEAAARAAVEADLEAAERSAAEALARDVRHGLDEVLIP
jgi:hypothetical protein